MWAAVPVKLLSESKTRLSSVLDADQREQLQLALVRNLLETVVSSREIQHTLVVTSDHEIARLSETAGAEVLPDQRSSKPKGMATDTASDSESGLNAALQEAAVYAESQGAQSLLVLPGDLPLITPADIAELFTAVKRHAHAVVVAPDRHGLGTNAMLSRPPRAIRYSFGPTSCEDHLGLAARAGAQAILHRSENLALDLDTPEDLAELLSRHTTTPQIQAILSPIRDYAGPSSFVNSQPA